MRINKINPIQAKIFTNQNVLIKKYETHKETAKQTTNFFKSYLQSNKLFEK